MATLGQGSQGGEDASYFAVVMTVNAPHVRRNGVNDNEARLVHLVERMVQAVDVGAQVESPLVCRAVVVPLPDCLENLHAGAVALGHFQAGADSICKVVFGGQKQDVALHLRLRGRVGPGAPGRDTRSHVEREDGLAQARIARQQRDFPNRDSARPEPSEAHSLDVCQAQQMLAIALRR